MVSDDLKQAVLIVGYGDVGARVARLLRSTRSVYALIRNPARAAAVASDGAVAVIGDLDDAESLAEIVGRTSAVFHAVLHFAPPAMGATDDVRTKNLIAVLYRSTNHRVRHLVYISTTGVYGDCGGRWVDESTPLNPESDRARRRVDAETCLAAWAQDAQAALTILRAPGIYAADRLPIDRIHAHTPAIRAVEDSWSNHIHAEDLARACVRALDLQIAHPADFAQPMIVNIVDDSVLKMGDYFDLVADHFGMPRPPRLTRREAESQVSPAMLSFMRESRRIRNNKMKTSLGYQLRYPTVGGFLAELPSR